MRSNGGVEHDSQDVRWWRRRQAEARPEVESQPLSAGGDIGRKATTVPLSSPLPLLLHGGGLDSTVCALILTRAGVKFTALHIDYGQDTFQQEHACIIQQGLELGFSVDLAVVPTPDRTGDIWRGRNALLFSVGLSRSDTIYTGIGCNPDDYPDASGAFLEAYRAMAAIYNPKARILAPTSFLPRLSLRQMKAAMAPDLPMWSCTDPIGGRECRGQTGPLQRTMCPHCRMDTS